MFRSFNAIQGLAGVRGVDRRDVRGCQIVESLRTIYRYWITVLFLAVVAQIAAAAYGGFYAAQKLGDQKGSNANKLISKKLYDHGFGFHTAFGYLIFVGAIVLLLLALGARLGKRRNLFALAVPITVALQIILAWASESVHGIGSLHGIDALIIFGLIGYMMGEAWRSRAPAAQPIPTAPAT
jgi:hypothetical protein